MEEVKGLIQQLTIRMDRLDTGRGRDYRQNTNSYTQNTNSYTHRIRTRTEGNRIPTHINQDGKTNLDNKLHQRQRVLTLERPDVTDVDS
jgi:hypothetical protein